MCIIEFSSCPALLNLCLCFIVFVRGKLTRTCRGISFSPPSHSTFPFLFLSPFPTSFSSFPLTSQPTFICPTFICFLSSVFSPSLPLTASHKKILAKLHGASWVWPSCAEGNPQGLGVDISLYPVWVKMSYFPSGGIHSMTGPK